MHESQQFREKKKNKHINGGLDEYLEARNTDGNCIFWILT